MKFTFFCEL